ncbi:18876_t:CDS:2, partial [Gigaspora rosea]
MSYKIHNEKNYSDNTSLSDVNDDVTELLTSGNCKIDYAIQSTQNHPVFSLTVIDYSEFSNIEMLGRGGFSIVFKANYEGNIVALKVIEGSKNMPSTFLNEETYCQIDLIRMIALQGLRPFIPDDLPQFYRNLMVRCWDKNPLLRPNAEEILSQLWNWHINSNIQKEIDKYDQTTCNEEIKDNTQYNPELYTSKFIRTDVVTNKSFAN